MNCLTKFASPQLERIHSGKVRDSFRVDRNTRMLVATDRISAFDKVLKTPIPNKGAVLNSLTNFWFAHTRHIVPNHFVAAVDPQITLAREATPIRIEMVVRGYLTGSMWRAYEKGKRTFSGIEVADGLTKNQRFPKPIITPTTKEEKDEEISPPEVVAQGLATRETWSEMERVALELFSAGTELLAKKGILLVDTKYEFGLCEGRLTLIDEIHTPDSSRFWSAEEWARDPQSCTEMDKEYVRRWLLDHAVDGKVPDALPPEVIEETTRRYLALFERVTGAPLAQASGDVRGRIYENLVKAKVIKDGYVVIVMGSPADLPHCQRLKEIVERYGLMADLRVVSAHKNGEDIPALAEEYNPSVEPGAVIAVAGLSNGLGGALASAVNLPVINCPPFKDSTDLLLNINSSLMMPSRVPAATVVNPESAALAAVRGLNLRRLRDQLLREISETKERLRQEDRRTRGR
jgi:phosphoribosylaminoimidazole-succinocarboxamide synthase